MNKNLGNVAGLLACAFVLSSDLKSQAAEYAVTIQTAPLASSSLSGNGPFSLDFAITYGGQSAGNTATINNFSFGGGAATGTPILTGNAAGSLSSAVTLSDSSSSFYNDLNQTFSPGTTVSFDVTLSDNPSAQTPDELAIAILDNTGGQIVTTDPNEGLSLATFEIRNFGTITTAAYAGIDNTDPNNLVDLGDYTGVTASVSAVPVPEPAPICILGLGLGVTGLFLARGTLLIRQSRI
jgi:hypothetical protein